MNHYQEFVRKLDSLKWGHTIAQVIAPFGYDGEYIVQISFWHLHESPDPYKHGGWNVVRVYNGDGYYDAFILALIESNNIIDLEISKKSLPLNPQ